MNLTKRELLLLNLMCEEQKEIYTELVSREGVRGQDRATWRDRLTEIENLQIKLNAANK